jgi:hypothetical protein
VAGETSGPHLALTLDLLEVAAAAESAITAPALIIRRHATYYGHDPEPRLRQSRQRRDMLDVLMREQAVKQITNPAPLVPAQLPPVSPTHPRTTLDQRRGHGDVSSDTEPWLGRFHLAPV